MLIGLLDWFKNRPSQFDLDRSSAELTKRAIDKAVSLVNPRLKLLRGCDERLGPAVDNCIDYLRSAVVAMPSAIEASSANWSSEPRLRAFFVGAADVPAALARSTNLRTLFDKYPELDAAVFILETEYAERQRLGMGLEGDFIRRDVAQTTVSFSKPRVRICGEGEDEVRRLLSTRAFEYLVAQAIVRIGEGRAERRDLEERRELLRTRRRLLQQHGPGLDSMFAQAPAATEEQQRLDEALLENERRLEALGSPSNALEEELDVLHDVLHDPERYLRLKQQNLRLNTMNVVVEPSDDEPAYDIDFSRADLLGEPGGERAFILARVERRELPPAPQMDLDKVARYL